MKLAARALIGMTLAAGLASCLGPGTLDDEQCADDARSLVSDSCLGCHVSSLSGDDRSGAPAGINFDTDADLARHADRIRVRAIDEGSMPPARPLLACDQALLDGLLTELESGTCEPACSGRDCGDDGCGGSCGDCQAGEECDIDGQCLDTTCTPDCGVRVCGDDGCGGSCGDCGTGETCQADGSCATQSLAFEADVWPIFTAAGCNSASCHGAASQSAGLDLRSAAMAHSNLVGVDSFQCASGVRVAAGDANASYLMAKLTGVAMCVGSQMPRGGTPLPSADLDTVRDWIDGGAAP